jgi:hypothetical protein
VRILTDVTLSEGFLVSQEPLLSKGQEIQAAVPRLQRESCGSPWWLQKVGVLSPLLGIANASHPGGFHFCGVSLENLQKSYQGQEQSFSKNKNIAKY